MSNAEAPMDTGEALHLLLDRQRELQGVIDAIEEGRLRQTTEQEDLVELSAFDQHPAETATETFDRERDLSVLAQAEAELVEVRHALERLANGTYGMCEVCGREIDDERLLAEPATRFCLVDMLRAEADARLKRQ